MKNDLMDIDTTAKTSAEIAALFYKLHQLVREYGPNANKHDLAFLLISICIDEGFNNGPQIIGILREFGFNPAHIAITLKQGIGVHWTTCGKAGAYQILTGG